MEQEQAPEAEAAVEFGKGRVEAVRRAQVLAGGKDMAGVDADPDSLREGTQGEDFGQFLEANANHAAPFSGGRGLDSARAPGARGWQRGPKTRMIGIMPPKPHIVLIGMPGSGKSSLGRCLAARLGMRFVDTDELIEAGEGCTLSRVLEIRGLAGFRRVEERHVRCLDLAQPPMVIATGGSVVYSAGAMAHLKSAGVVIFLDADLDTLRRRLGDLAARGVVIAPRQGLGDLFAERRPLYLAHAEVVFPGAFPTPGEAAAELAGCLAEGRRGPESR